MQTAGDTADGGRETDNGGVRVYDRPGRLSMLLPLIMILVAAIVLVCVVLLSRGAQNS